MVVAHKHKTQSLPGIILFKQRGNRYTEWWRKLIQHQNVGAGESALPFWYCLRCKAEFFGNLALFFARLAAQAGKPATKFFRVQHRHLLCDGSVCKETNAPEFLEIFLLPGREISCLLVGVRYPWGERKISDFIRIEHNPPPFFDFILKTRLYFPWLPTRTIIAKKQQGVNIPLVEFWVFCFFQKYFCAHLYSVKKREKVWCFFEKNQKNI